MDATIQEMEWLIHRLQARVSLEKSSPDGASQNVTFGDGRNGLSLGAIESRLFSVQKEQRCLQGVLDSLKQDEQLLDCARKRALNALTAVGRLPDEILSMIFTSEEPCCRPFRDDITAVCHRWRKVTLETPAYWSAIEFCTSDDWCTPLEAIQTYIKRSCTSPLFISIVFDWRGMSLSNAIVSRNMAFKALEPCLSRCSRMDVEFHHLQGDELLRILVPMPSLKELYVTLHSTKDEIPELMYLSTGPECSPRVFSLQGTVGWAEVFVDALHFDSTQLIDVHIDHTVTAQSAWTFLRSCPSISSLSWSYNGPFPENLDQLHFPKLQTIEVPIDPPVVEKIHAPSLRSLSLTYPTQRHRNTSQPCFTYALLRSLHIGKAGWETQTFSKYLFHFSCLENLTYEIEYKSHISRLKLLASIHPKASPATVVCPSLRSLVLCFPVQVTDYDAPLASLLRTLALSRGATVVPDPTSRQSSLKTPDTARRHSSHDRVAGGKHSFDIHLPEGLTEYEFPQTMEVRLKYSTKQ